MGRELQKKKNRSSIRKVRHKPKSKKRILNHPVIAANWDKSQTLEQNYRRLGLTTKLNKNTGGTERQSSDVLRVATGEDEQNTRDALKIVPSKTRKTQLDISEAKIERDPATDKILRVLDDENETARKPNPLNDPLAELDSDTDGEKDSLLTLYNQHGNIDPARAVYVDDRSNKTEVVRQLEYEARLPAAKKQRRQPDSERDLVMALVRKYGDDYTKMARDIKINYMQQSEGEIKRKVKRWRENGGTLG